MSLIFETVSVTAPGVGLHTQLAEKTRVRQAPLCTQLISESRGVPPEGSAASRLREPLCMQVQTLFVIKSVP